jgi:hypothetical protein
MTDCVTVTDAAGFSQKLPLGVVLPDPEGLEDIVRRYSILHEAVSVMTELFPPVVTEEVSAEPE